METLKGKILYTSWGYDKTLNDYAVIVEETDKTVKCKMLGRKVESDSGMGNGKSMPTLEETGGVVQITQEKGRFQGKLSLLPRIKKNGVLLALGR